MTLLTTVLAVFAAWELLITLLPVGIPAWLQPALVAGCAFGARQVPHEVLLALAVTGGVALCHTAVTTVRAPVVRGRSVRLPRL